MTTLERAAQLLEILQLEKIEENLYLGRNEDRGTMRLFGGQVLAQATQAAYQTLESLEAHSLHAYFLTAGKPDRPVLYEVERIRDGRSFTTRRVVAIQDGTAIFNMDVSFQIEELGFAHAHPMPNVPPPHELREDLEVAKEVDPDIVLSPMAKRGRPFEMRSVFELGSAEWQQDRFFSPTWVKFPQNVDQQSTSRCLLAYVSDMGLVSTATLPHKSAVQQFQLASLDHALWIHRPVDIGGWLLMHKRTTNASSSRGMVHAEFFSLEGELVASSTQEGLM